MGMSVELKGFEDTSRALRRLVKKVHKDTVNKHVKKYAEGVQTQLRSRILMQSFKLRPLTKRYLQRKIAQGYDRRILVRSSRYVKAIKVQSAGKRGYRVGFSRKAMTVSGVPMEKLAFWIEHGTRGRNGMRPRPHWRIMEHYVSKTYGPYMRKMISNDVRRSR